MITIAFQLAPRDPRDMRSTSVYEFELVPGKTVVAGAFDSYALLYAVLHNGIGTMCSMSRANGCLALGDSFGLVHIIKERSYRIFNNDVCVDSTTPAHGSNRPLWLAEEGRDLLVSGSEALAVLMWP